MVATIWNSGPFTILDSNTQTPQEVADYLNTNNVNPARIFETTLLTAAATDAALGFYED